MIILHFHLQPQFRNELFHILHIHITVIHITIIIPLCVLMLCIKFNPFPSTCRSRLLAKEEYKYTPLTSSDFLWWKAGWIKLCLILMHVHRHNLRKIFLLNISSDNNIFREALILNFQLHMLFCGIPVAFCGIFLTSGRCFMLIDNCISDNLK